MSGPKSLPLVSIVILAYNAEAYLRECLQSVVDQTYTHLEILVIDDASSDNTLSICNQYARDDNRVSVLPQAENRGIAACRNQGIEHASGDFLAWLDSDDVAMPERIATQVGYLQDHPECVLVSSDLIIIDEGSRVVGARTYPQSDAEIRKVLTRSNPFAQPASMLRKCVLDRVGKYDESLECCEDYDLFVRMATKGKVANIAMPLTRYRISTFQSKTRKLKATIRNTLLVQKRALSMGFPDSLLSRCYRMALRGVQFLPDKLILWLFKRMTYSAQVPGEG